MRKEGPAYEPLREQTRCKWKWKAPIYTAYGYDLTGCIWNSEDYAKFCQPLWVQGMTNS
jgi:hypothetical protein